VWIHKTRVELHGFLFCTERFSMKMSGPVVRGMIAGWCALTLAGAAMAGEPLRVCADPDNLPFSASEGAEHGIYVELAELVAQKIDAAPVKFTWWLTYNQRKALRLTAGECDAIFALPTNADYRARGLQKTAAFLDVGYVLVSAQGFEFNNLNDLKGKRLGVQYQTNPHILLSQRDDLPFTTLKTSDEVFAALAKGEIDAGFLWGPVAGYDNQRRFSGRWKITPLAGPDLTGQVSVAVVRDKPELLKSIDAALLALKPEIAALAVKYGFPTGNSVNLKIVSNLESPKSAQAFATNIPAQWVSNIQATSADEAAPSDKPVIKPKPKPKSKTKGAANAAKAAKAAKAGIAADSAAKAAGGGVAVQEAAVQTPALSQGALLGRVRFNDQCSHCHGSDGASPLRERDVRRLKMRYDTKWRDVAMTTIKNGRNDLGMPPWKDILKEQDIEQLLGFLESLQK
jgi:polar amino acid transport system substrate-binding protein